MKDVVTITCAECGLTGVSSLAQICPNCQKNPHPAKCIKCGIVVPRSSLDSSKMCNTCQKESERQKAVYQTGACACCGNTVERTDHSLASAKTGPEFLCLGRPSGYCQHGTDLTANKTLDKEIGYDKQRYLKEWTKACTKCGHPATWFECPICREIKFGEPIEVTWRHWTTRWGTYRDSRSERREESAKMLCCQGCEPKARALAKQHQTQAEKEVYNQTKGCGCLSVIVGITFSLGGLILLHLLTTTWSF